MTAPESTPSPGDDPAERAVVITQSLKAYGHAWLGFIPVVGMVFCVTALIWAWQASRSEGRDWNPARRYRRAAAWIAGLACLLWLILDSALLMVLLNRLR